MRVPTANVRKRYLQTNTGFDQLRSLPESIAKWRGRIIRAVLRLVLPGICLFQVIDSFESFLPRAMQYIVYSLIVNSFEAPLNRSRTLSSANVEISEVRNRERWRFSLHDARHILRHGDGAEEGLLRIAFRLQIAI